MTYQNYVEVLVGKQGAEGKLIKDLTIEFSVRFNITNSTNSAEIRIFNMSDETYNYLLEKDSSVILKVGEDRKVLYIGDIVSVSNAINRSDSVTIIECKDGYYQLANRKISVGFEENVDINTVLNKVISDVNFIKGKYNLPNKTYKNGFSAVGTLAEVLTKIVKSLGGEYTYKIVNRALLIYKKNEPIPNSPVYNLTLESGILEIPYRFYNFKINRNETNSNISEGWKIRTLLIPELLPESIIRIQTSEVSGLFRVKESEFVGSQTEWFCNLKIEQK